MRLWPSLIALFVVLLVFQLVLRPGVAFSRVPASHSWHLLRYRTADAP